MKKLLSIVLIAAMTLSLLVGCGGNGSQGNSGSSETWKIGGIGPATGGAAVYGIAVRNGIQIAVDEINEAGGINGVQIEYNYQDDEHNEEKAVNAYNTLKDWGMNVLIGTVTSGPCVAVTALSSQDNMFQLTPSGSSTAIIESNIVDPNAEVLEYDANVFQVCFVDPNQGVGSAQYIGANAVAQKVAVIYDSSDIYSGGIYEKFREEAANQPFEIVAETSFTADSATDFSVQLQQAKDAGAELVFLPIYYQEASLILTQADTMDYHPIFFGCDGLDGILAVDGFDTELAEGVVLLTPFVADAEDERTQAFVNTYQEKYGEIPNQFAADAYDAVYIIKEAIEASGAAPADGYSAICDKLAEAMTTITYDGLTGDGMTWSASGEVAKDPKAMVIENGVYTNFQ